VARLPLIVAGLVSLALLGSAPARAGEPARGVLPESLALYTPGSASEVTDVRRASPDVAKRRVSPATDRSEGRAIEMVPGERKRFIYDAAFRGARSVEDPAIEGVSCLRWDDSAPALHIEGRGPGRRRVSLTYHFTAPYDAKEMVTDVQGVITGTTGDVVEMTMSADGRTFIHPARACGRAQGHLFHLSAAASYRFDGPRFWVRIVADVAPGSRVTLEQFRVNCRLKPPERPEVALATLPASH
jgi:hypothetical protein